MEEQDVSGERCQDISGVQWRSHRYLPKQVAAQLSSQLQLLYIHCMYSCTTLINLHNTQIWTIFSE